MIRHVAPDASGPPRSSTTRSRSTARFSARRARGSSNGRRPRVQEQVLDHRVRLDPQPAAVARREGPQARGPGTTSPVRDVRVRPLAPREADLGRIARRPGVARPRAEARIAHEPRRASRRPRRPGTGRSRAAAGSPPRRAGRRRHHERERVRELVQQLGVGSRQPERDRPRSRVRDDAGREVAARRTLRAPAHARDAVEELGHLGSGGAHEPLERLADVLRAHGRPVGVAQPAAQREDPGAAAVGRPRQGLGEVRHELRSRRAAGPPVRDETVVHGRHEAPAVDVVARRARRVQLHGATRHRSARRAASPRGAPRAARRRPPTPIRRRPRRPTGSRRPRRSRRSGGSPRRSATASRLRRSPPRRGRRPRRSPPASARRAPCRSPPRSRCRAATPSRRRGWRPRRRRRRRRWRPARRRPR